MIPVIICGGAGTRLWPVSREAHPKPLMKLADGQNLLQKAHARATALPGVSNVLAVTARETYLPIRAACDELAASGVQTSYLLEPSARNTSAAIAAAAIWVRERHGADNLMLVLPADHLIEPQEEFARAVAAAAAAARGGDIVTFGIEPTAPETGYGYIAYDRSAALIPGVHRVERFVEKPDLARARELLQSGNHLWNSGMFCFTAETILRELAQYAGDVLAQVEQAFAAGRADGPSLTLDAAAFAQVRSISIDYAVMEKSPHVAVVPSSMRWSDIGSWTSLSDLQAPDEQGNRLRGQVLLHATSNCYIDSPHRVLGVVGVRDLVIVDTPDALLVADAGQVQEVRQIVSQLKALSHDAARVHRHAEHDWGSSTTLDADEQFETRRMTLGAGSSWSSPGGAPLEQLLVLRGRGELITSAGTQAIDQTHCAAFDPGAEHELRNPGPDPLVVLAIRHRPRTLAATA